MSREAEAEDGHYKPRACDHQGCVGAGEFRAPRSRDPRTGHFWFCLDHVRQYNAAWNFFAGMSQSEIEQYQKNNPTWHRPTWRLGVRPGSAHGFGAAPWIDPFDLVGEAGLGQKSAKAEPPPLLDPEERRALATLDLAPRPTLGEIKRRYKELVKKLHPDTNGGDRKAEEKLKKINQAYTYLMSCGYR